MAVTTKKFLIALVVLASLCSVQAFAQRKTDVISMYNGDRVTGEIKKLWGGILEVSTDSMGTLRIEWPEIAKVQSEFFYELRLSDGERMYGSLADESRPGQVVLVDIFGRHEIEWLQVVEIRPIEESFAERLDIYLSTTFSYTKASDLAQVALNTVISYEDKGTRNTFSGRSDIVDTNEERSQSSRYEVNRMLWRENRSGAYRAIFANYEDNDELDLDRRIGAGAGLGRYFIDTHRSRLLGTAGLQVINESFAGESDNQDVELFLNTNFAAWKFTTPELNVDLSFTLYPSLTDSGRVRSDGNLRIRWELVEDLFWDITAWVSTDNQSESGNSTDYSITTGIGWEY